MDDVSARNHSGRLYGLAFLEACPAREKATMGRLALLRLIEPNSGCDCFRGPRLARCRHRATAHGRRDMQIYCSGSILGSLTQG